MMKPGGESALKPDAVHAACVRPRLDLAARSRIASVIYCALAVFMSGLLPSLVNAEQKGAAHSSTKPRYTMPEGRGWAVCESYFRFLNATPSNEGPPLCDLKFDRVPGMARPDTEELELAEHLPLIHQIELILGASNITPMPAQDVVVWREQFERRAIDGQKPRLRRLRGELVPGGPSEIVLICDVDVMRCSAHVQRKDSAFLAGSFLFLFDPARNRVLRRNLIGFDHRPIEVLSYNRRLYAFENFVGSDFLRSNQKTVIAGWVHAHRFQFVGKMADGPDPDTSSYGQHELCRIQFDYPFPR